MDDKNVLAVDTSSRLLSVAIRAGKTGVFEANLEGTPRHSEQLIDLIEEGLKRLGLKKNDLDHFIWGLGPGSFTGLRIGLSVLKGFHLGFKKKSFGGSSLDTVAFGSGMVSGELAVCVDARRQRIYTAIYRFHNGLVQKVLRDSLFSFDQLAAKIKRQTVVAGDALSVYGDLIRKKVGRGVLFLNPSFWYPRSLFLIRLCDEKREWLRPLKLKDMVPQYLRLSEAEEKFGRSKSRT